MSVFEALTLILGALVFGIYVIMGISRMSESLGRVIYTGVQDGLPLSLEHRWMILWNYYLATMLTGAAFGAGTAMALAQVARHVADPKIRTLAHVVMIGWILSSLLWVLGGINGVLYLSSALKKAR